MADTVTASAGRSTRVLVVPLGLALLIYGAGWLRLAKRASTPPRGAGLFLSGWAVLTLALVSPLHEARRAQLHYAHDRA